MLSDALIDLRYSVRSLSRNPGLALALLFTISVGIGSNVAIYGFIRGLNSSDSPLAAASGVMSVFRRDPNGGLSAVSYDEYLAVKKHGEAFEWIGGAQVSRRTVVAGGRSMTLSVAAVTPDVARMARLSLGNGVFVSHRVWETEFAGRAKVERERIRVGGVDLPIAGIAPEALEGIYEDRPIDLWMPFHEESLDKRDSGIRNFWVLARVREGAAARPFDNAEARFLYSPYTGRTPELTAGLLRYTALLRVAAGFVFFIACANVASLLLGRATVRSHETSLRVALGAERGQIARAVFCDSAVLALAGGSLGVFIAIWTAKIVPAFLFEQDAAALVLAPDRFALVFVPIIGAAVIVACGLLPIFESPHDRPADVLRRESAGPSRGARAMRSGLAVAQMACCCLLVISVGFLRASFRSSLRTTVSHHLGDPILATVEASPNAGIQYFRSVQGAVKSIASISETTWAARLPGSRPAWTSFRIEPQRLPLHDVTLNVARFTADSLDLFAFPPKQGRMFGSGDQRCQAVIANEEAAEVLFGGETAGRLIYDSAGRRVEIIGVLAMKSSRNPPTVYYYDQGSLAGGSRFRAPEAADLQKGELDTHVVSFNYFDAMGFSVVAGRLFTEQRDGGECRVGVINQEAADLYFGGNAVGASVIDDGGRRTEIVGVVHSPQLGTLQRREEPAIYFPMTQDWLPRMTLIIGTREANDVMLAEVRRTVEAVTGSGPSPPVVKTLDTHLSQTALAPLRIAAVIMGASTIAGLLLSVIGLYGTLSDAARQRSRELALRIALGAKRRHVIGRVLADGARLAGVGTVVGLAGAVALVRWLPGLARDSGGAGSWLVWISGPVVLAVGVTLASVLPARRAVLINPMRILREDR